MAEVKLEAVRKIYPGGVEAVKGISLDIADGEFIVLVGPSGCGKSTLLRMVAGLETITSGTVSIGGRTVNKVEPAGRDIAMVFQNYALYPHMSVYGNLAYGLKNQGMAKDAIEARVKEAARILEIGNYLTRKPRQLSGGQRQRVAMGRAIVREPAAFLFDEPLSNLDAKLRVQMRGEIRQLQKRLGTTSIYVTHDQLEAMTLADRLVVLNGGEIEQTGAPLDIYRSPASTFVAGFIGSPAMSMVKAQVDGNKVRLGGASLPLPRAVRDRGEITLGLRAEDLTPQPGPGEANIPLAVAYVEELGSQRLVHGHVEGQPMVAAIAATREIGDTIYLGTIPQALHLFDATTGKRLN